MNGESHSLMLATDRHPTRTELRKAKTYADLLDAAAEVMAEFGFHEAKVQVIADRADVGTGTVYNYFSSKDEIFEALVADTLAGLKTRLDAARDDDAEAETNLRAGWRALLEFAHEHQNRFRVCLGQGPGFHNFMQQAHAQFAETLESNLQQDIHRGQLRPHNTSLMAAASVGLATHVVSWWLEHPELSIDSMVEEICTYELQGLVADTAAGSSGIG